MSTFEVAGRPALKIEPAALTLLARQAMIDIAHLLRPGHLQQLRNILDDPEASDNDRFVALELLKNANIAASGVLPGCQDTGTATVIGYKGENVFTFADDEEALSRGVYEAYTQKNLRYSQMAPIDMYTEKNTGSNLPAQIDLYAAPGDAYKFLFLAKGGGSANKTYLFQETKALLNPESLLKFVADKVRGIGTSRLPALPPGAGHRRAVGGDDAEDGEAGQRPLPGQPAHHRQRPGARLPRRRPGGSRCWRSAGRPASARSSAANISPTTCGSSACPATAPPARWAWGCRCSADRQVLGKITRDGVFLEQLETNPARFLPEVTEQDLGGQVVEVDLRRPMPEILAELRRHPVATRLSLSGPLIVARDIAHAKLKERLDRGEDLPGYFKDHAVYYAGPAKRPEGLRLGIVRPDHRRAHGRLRRSVPGARGQHGDAGQGQPVGGGARRLPQARRVLPGVDRRAGGAAGRALDQEGGRARVPGAGHGGDLEASRWRTSPPSSWSTPRATTSTPGWWTGGGNDRQGRRQGPAGGRRLSTSVPRQPAVGVPGVVRPRWRRSSWRWRRSSLPADAYLVRALLHRVRDQRRDEDAAAVGRARR